MGPIRFGLSSSVLYPKCAHLVVLVWASFLLLFIAPAALAASRVPGATVPDLPLAFVANTGQFQSEVVYASGTPGRDLRFTPSGVVIRGAEPTTRDPRLALELVDHSPSLRLAARGPGPTRVSYVRGADPAGWRMGLPTYLEVVYHDAWPGIEVAFRASQGRLKYDIVVAPGARPGDVRLAYRGADGVAIDADGNLLVRSAGAVLVDARPTAHQDIEGRRVPVGARFVVLPSRGPSVYGIAVDGTYDPSYPLVIDPDLAYSVVLGGGNGTSTGAHAVAVDAQGHAWVTGQTTAAGLATANASDAFFSGGTKTHGFTDAFVAKFAPDGTLLMLTYLGGTDADVGYGIAVDAAGSAYVAGSTYSSDFPVRGAAAPRISGNADAFVTKFAADGALVYSTFLGGGGFDAGHAIAVDGEGNAYVTGQTLSSNFPVSPGAFSASRGKVDAFITKLSPAGSALAYSTYLGGKGKDVGRGIAVDAQGNAYVVGETESTDFPTTAGALDRSANGGVDAFVTKLNPVGAALGYSTFVGGAGNDVAHGVAVDGQGRAYVTGATSSPGFPTTPSAFQRALRGTSDAFVLQLGAAGNALGYSTFLGGAGAESGQAIVVDTAGLATLSGYTASADFPTTSGAFDTAGPLAGGAADAFVVTLAADGQGLVYATYLGGSGVDIGYGIARHAGTPAVVVAGQTSSPDFPATSGSVAAAAALFVTRLAIRPATTTALDVNPAAAVFGEPVILTAAVSSSSGTPDGSVEFFDGEASLGTGSLVDGRASLTLTSLGVGPHSLSARYAGSGAFQASESAAVALAVTPASTATAVTASPSGAVTGEPVTLTATVTVVVPGAGIPTGTVTFRDSGGAIGLATLSSGQATLVTSFVDAGSHELTADYSGDANFTGSTSPPGTSFLVGQATTTTAVTSSAGSSVAGDPVTFTAAVSVVAPGSGAPTGIVEFREGTVVLAAVALDASGQATFTTSALGIGYHEITAVYLGSGDFAGSSSAVTTLAQTVLSNPTVTATDRVGASALHLNCRFQRVNITGTGLLPPTSSPPNIAISFSGTGIVVRDVGYTSPTSIWADVDVAAEAPAISRRVTVVNPDGGTGTSAGAILDVGNPAPCPDGGLAPKTTASMTVTAPAITVSPVAANVGGSVSISGTGLGAAASDNAVTFAGLSGTRASAVVTSCCAPIVATVPATAVDGPLTVTAAGLTSNEVGFTVTTPRLASVTPGSAAPSPAGPITVNLTLAGSKFATGASVSFAPSTGITVGAPAVAPDGTVIQVSITLDPSVPAGARDVIVTNPSGSGVASSTLVAGFTVKPPSIASLELSLPGTPADSYLPAVQQVSVTLDAAGRCTGKTVAPAAVALRAEFSSLVTTPPASVTFRLVSSALPGTAINEDCEPGGAAGFDFSLDGGNQAVQEITVPATVAGGGTFDTTLYSWDWGGTVVITVSGVAGNGSTITGTLTSPVDVDGDGLPGAFEAANGLNPISADQDGNGVPDGQDRFARDGLSNGEKYRGVYASGPVAGIAGTMTGHIRLAVGSRHLFARGRGFADDPAVQASPGTCGIDPRTGAPVADATLSAANPCPVFEVGSAFAAAGVEVHNVSSSFTASTELPRRSLVDGTSPTLDMVTVVYDAVNCYGSQACDFTSKVGARNWSPATLGFSGFGGPTAYAASSTVYKRAVESYFKNRPYQHRTNGSFVTAPDGTPMLTPLAQVGDKNDNGIRDTSKESVDATGELVSDTYVAGNFNLHLSAVAVTSDGCVQLPLVSDPTSVARCTNPAAASGPAPAQATKRQVARHVVTHELGHAVGVNTHTTDSTDLMYQYSINWIRDGHFSPSAAGLLQIHNKGLQ